MILINNQSKVMKINGKDHLLNKLNNKNKNN